jgi:hypothetical protein
MIDLSINVTVPPEVARLPGAMEALQEGARAAGAARAAAGVRDHLLQLDQRPNKWGVKKHFFSGMVSAVKHVSDSSSAAVIMSDVGFWRRWLGGPAITPKTRKYLALPANAMAYKAGRPAAKRGLPELAIVYRRRAGAVRAVALADDVRTSKRSGRKYATFAGQIYYWLVKSANPKADPSVGPDVDAIAGHAQRAAADYVSRKVRSLMAGGAAA